MRRLLFTITALIITALAGAQEPGVARLSLIRGTVSTQSGSGQEWSTGAINAPLMAGDSVATGEDGRAEVQLDYADTLRLDSNASITIVGLDAGNIVVDISQGLVDFVQSTGAEAAVEMRLPNLNVRPAGPGVYRMQVNSADASWVTARAGQAEIVAPQGNLTLAAGQMIAVLGSENPEYQITAANAVDEWDQWNQERDQTIASAQSWTHTDRYYTGAADLDAYGHWIYVPDYGQVWQPVVGPYWAPYSAGTWVYQPFWGWTWVSYEPWGWAPYHYGRWFFYGAAWVWWPGPVRGVARYRPVWAPAYVSFMSFHTGVATVGWIPIGPADAYHPWWGRAGRAVGPLAPVGLRSRVWASNLNRMSDDHIIRAVTAVRAENFGRGRVSPQPLTAAEIQRGTRLNGLGGVGGKLPAPPPGARRTLPSGASPTRPGFHSFGKPTVAAQPGRLPAHPPSRPQPQPGRIPQPRPAPQPGRAPATARPAPQPSRPQPSRPQPSRPQPGQAAPHTVAPSSPPKSGRGRGEAPAAQGSRAGWHTFTPQPGGKRGEPAKPATTKKGRGGGGV